MKARWPKHNTTPSLFLLAIFTFIAHNSPWLPCYPHPHPPPFPPPIFCITIVFTFPFNDCNTWPEFRPITSSRYYSLERRKRLEAIGWISGYVIPRGIKLKTVVRQNLGVNKMYYGKYEIWRVDSVLSFWHWKQGFLLLLLLGDKLKYFNERCNWCLFLSRPLLLF